MFPHLSTSGEVHNIDYTKDDFTEGERRRKEKRNTLSAVETVVIRVPPVLSLLLVNYAVALAVVVAHRPPKQKK